VVEFERALTHAAGKLLRLADYPDLESALRVSPAHARAKTVCSLVPGFARHNVDPKVDNLRSLSHVQLAVFASELGVAESGAVWLEFERAADRALLFLAEHVVVALPVGAIVSHLHQAYEHVVLGARHFGCFVAGPSKTADIEQSLILGAHGPRSLTVLLV
jgi:L-lactate dehydrogenase complex protein LldG